MMTEPLEQEIATFERELDRLTREHAGKFVLVHGEEIVDAFDTFENAADAGLARFGAGPFLIRQVGGDEPRLSIAAMYRIDNGYTPNPDHG